MKQKQKFAIILQVFVWISAPLWAQTGPGGVGYSDDSEEEQPELVLWLKADDLSGDGSKVAIWYDASGNGRDAQKGDLLGPVYLEKGMKGMPCVLFDGASWLNVKEESHPGGMDGGPGISIFFIVQPQAIDQGGGMKLIAKRNHWNLWAAGLTKDICKNSFNLDFHGRDENQYLMAHVNGNLPGNKVETEAIYGDTSEILLVNYNYNGVYAAISVNGEITSGLKPNPNFSMEAIGMLEDYDNDVTIGAAKYDPLQAGDPGPIADFLTARVGEIALYRTGLDSTRMLIVENYLAAKYHLDIAGDKRYMDSVHIHNLLGIGTQNGTDIHRESGNGILTASDKTASIDLPGEFLWIGDNGVEVEWVDDNVPEDWESRWSRIYKIEKSGELEVTLSFSFIEAGVSLIKGTDYTLLYREKPEDPFTTTGLKGSPKFGALSFVVPGDQLKTGQYTIGMKSASTGVGRTFTPEAFSIVPNPVGERIRIENPGNVQIDRIILSDLSGRVIEDFSQDISSGFELYLHEAGPLNEGIYLLHIIYNGGFEVCPIVKLK